MNANLAAHYSPNHAPVSEAQALRDIHAKGSCFKHNDIRIWEYKGSVRRQKIYKECWRCAEIHEADMQIKRQQLQLSHNEEDRKKLQNAINELDKEKIRNNELQMSLFESFRRNKEEIKQRQKAEKAEKKIAAELSVRDEESNKLLIELEKERKLKETLVQQHNELRKRESEDYETQRILIEHYEKQKLEKAEQEVVHKARVEHAEHYFNIALAGDTGVGKSSILVQFADHRYIDHPMTTIGVDYKVATLKVACSDGKHKTVSLKISDTAGQERFRTMAASYFQRTQGVLLVFDVSMPASFTCLGMWLSEIRQVSDAIVVLVGNKVDQERVVSTEVAQQWAHNNGLTYMESSAKANEGISKLFETMVEKILEKQPLINSAEKSEINSKSALNVTVPCASAETVQDKGKCCVIS